MIASALKVRQRVSADPDIPVGGLIDALNQVLDDYGSRDLWKYIRFFFLKSEYMDIYVYVLSSSLAICFVAARKKRGAKRACHCLAA